MTALTGVAKGLLALADILWPPQCHICGSRPQTDSGWLCGKCLSHLPKARFGDNDMNPMAQRLAGKIPFVRASAYLIYNPGGMLGPLFHDFKYNGFRQLARYMGRMAADDFGTMPFFNDIDALLPIPLHPFRHMRRGYNQAREIALGIGLRLHIPVDRGLTAIKPHRTQTGMTTNRRMANTKDIFRYRPEKELLGKHVAIIDDVCTTGSTLLSAAQAVLDADPKAKISFFTLGVVI